MLLLLALANAATLAVLPLDATAESTAHPGLGRALAGMMTSDLSGLDGLTLIERDRLDAVLAEIELGDSGYLDPATAQRAGSGLGVEQVIVGSWSEIGAQLALDARVVSVRSGEVLAAASAAGPTQEFVALEKSLVADLLGDLQVALTPAQSRRLMLDAPTEVYGALVAYGEGLEHDAAGELEAARAAYTAALAADPQFAAATTALAQLRAATEASAARDAATAAAEQDDVYTRAAALGAGLGAEDLAAAELARHLLRWYGLFGREEHCTRLAEMSALWDAADHDVRSLPRTYPDTVRLAFANGLETPRRAGQDFLEGGELSQAAGLLSSNQRFLLGYDEGEPGHRSSQSLLGAVMRCQPPETWVPTLERWEADVRRSGAGDEATDREYSAWTTARRLLTTRALVQAQQSGVDDALSRELARLLDSRDLDEGGRSYARMRLQSIERAAARWQSRHVRRRGLDDATITALAHSALAYTSLDPGRDMSGVCSLALRSTRPAAERLLPELESRRGTSRDEALAQLAAAIAPSADLGCLPPSLGELREPGSVARRLDAHALLVPVSEDCRRALSDLRERTQNNGNPPNDFEHTAVVQQYHRELVDEGCVGLQPLR